MRKHTLILFLLISAFIIKAQNARTTITLAAGDFSVTSYTDKEVILNSKTNLHITSKFAKTSLNNSVIHLNTVDSWVYLDNIRPQTVLDSLLKYIYINGNLAVNKTNARVSIYKQGAVIIPHSSQFQPLKVFTSPNFAGDSTTLPLFSFNNSLGIYDNNIRSFKLKRGYMATFATASDGTGYSRVYIADDSDLEVSVLPDLLNHKVSFIRVLSWEYVSKKGWCGSDFNQYTKTKSTWRYDWSAGGSTTSYVEYVPIKQNLGWPGWSEISNKQYVTHALGYNEPDHTEQSNVTVAQAIAEWPNMLKTGLRVGSPAVTNNSWLYQFMDSCKARNYRVDYVAYHAYWGGKSPQNWYNDLKAIYLRTGRPIWITEWNNGANWTNETWPTADKSLSAANAAKQLSDIKAILNVLDTASFIERYSIYNWVQDCRAMVLADTLTPAGKYYAANNPGMAFKRNYEVIPTFTFGNPSLNISYGTNSLTLTESDPNAESFEGMVIEKNIDDEGYKEFYNNSSITRSTTDGFDLSSGTKFRYKVKAKLPTNVYTAFSPETGYDVTNNSDIQCGKLQYTNVGWNAVFFRKTFSSLPTIILGSPTNNNTNVLMSPRVKINSATRFNVQLAPWSYQKVSTLSKEETVPYLALSSGSYNFGGLKALVDRKSLVGSTWTQVTFSTPFDTIPVVFATQWLASTTFATTVRIKNVTKTGFQLKIQKETGVNSALSGETVSYFAIVPGKGIMDGRKIIVGKTADTFVSPTLYKTIQFGDSIDKPIFLSQLQTCNDDTVTATLRCLTLTAKYANVIKQREKSTTATYALTEGAGWMVIDPVSIIQATNNPLDNEEISVYPNPVTDYLYFRKNGTETLEVEVYNLYGVLVKKFISDKNRLNVSDLNSGCYILKTGNMKTAKFVKL